MAIYRSNRKAARPNPSGKTPLDLALVSGVDNFSQALQALIGTPFGAIRSTSNMGSTWSPFSRSQTACSSIKDVIRLNLVKSLHADDRVREIVEIVFDDEADFAALAPELAGGDPSATARRQRDLARGGRLHHDRRRPAGDYGLGSVAMTDYGVTPPGFVVKPFTDILNAKLALAQQLFGPDVDLRSTSALRKMLDVASIEDQEHWKALEGAYYSNFISTAMGDALNLLGDDLGLARGNQQASGQVTFTSTGAAPGRIYMLLVGTLVETATGDPLPH